MFNGYESAVVSAGSGKRLELVYLEGPGTT